MENLGYDELKKKYDNKELMLQAQIIKSRLRELSRDLEFYQDRLAKLEIEMGIMSEALTQIENQLKIDANI